MAGLNIGYQKIRMGSILFKIEPQIDGQFKFDINPFICNMTKVNICCQFSYLILNGA